MAKDYLKGTSQERKLFNNTIDTIEEEDIPF
jgi:hypothetical protein